MISYLYIHSWSYFCQVIKQRKYTTYLRDKFLVLKLLINYDSIKNYIIIVQLCLKRLFGLVVFT